VLHPGNVMAARSIGTVVSAPLSSGIMRKTDDAYEVHRVRAARKLRLRSR
jgi:hypothetical protein